MDNQLMLIIGVAVLVIILAAAGAWAQCGGAMGASRESIHGRSSARAETIPIVF